MLRNLYQRVLLLAASPFAPVWLAVVAFAESSFFPVPPDALLIPMALARPDRALRYALITTVASVAGGMLGYWIGYALFEQVARPLLALYHYEAAYTAFQDRFAQVGLWIILIKGLLPIPYKIITIASGAAKFDFVTFVVASAVTRGVRFFLEAGLLMAFGDQARVFIDRRLPWILIATAVLAVLGFGLIRYV
ncbi:YqaA family protein [Acidisphaera sp. L21]|uniref:YqaA family protein n=1 Tax=Acidisphaera sp. L21 TaxID=1641851 RepID=UPI00131B05E9|nr:YqaA family protein [Acidisphaera sp. L21]